MPMLKEVQALLKACDASFKSRDRALYSTARANLKRGIEEAQWVHNNKIVEQFTEQYQGLQQITNFKGNITDSKLCMLWSLTASLLNMK